MPNREHILSVSRKIQFAGKARLLDFFGIGPSNPHLVPSGINSVECVNGIVIETSCNQDIMFRELYVNGQYQDDVLVALRNLLRPGEVFWDIGANYGFMSIYVDRLFRGTVRVIAFEPSPLVLAEIRKNLVLNKCSKVAVEPICLSDHAGTVTFFVSENQSWNATMIPAFARTHGGHTQLEVEASTIDECVQRLPPPDVIKLDVEGAEHLVIQGGSQFLARKRPAMIVEYNVHAIRDAGLTPTDYLDLFRKCGYEINALRRPWVGPFRWRSLHRIRNENELAPLCNLIMLRKA